MSARVGRLLPLALLLVLGLLLVACDDGDETAADGAATGTSALANADVERYCRVAERFNREIQAVFQRLQEAGATPEEFEQAQREYVRAHQDDLEEIGRVAPEAIRDDVGTLVASVRAGAGLGPEVSPDRIDTAGRRLERFEARNCRRAPPDEP